MNIVFDFGGVVFRWRPMQVVQAALPQRVAGHADAAHWAQQVFQGGGGDWGEFDRGTLDVPTLVARIARRCALAPAEVQAVVQAVADELQPLPETVALLEDLHAAGHRLFYLSNMPAPYAAQFEARHGFMQRFSDGVFSSRVGLIKPEPAIFDLAAARFRVPASELLLLDDHAPNVQAAQAAGWRALQFTDAAAARAALKQITAGTG
jgi:putative hydrolase of the HAD superfamily